MQDWPGRRAGIEDGRGTISTRPIVDRCVGLFLIPIRSSRLDLIDRTHPDVVITDLVMPVLDGLQLIQRLFMQGLRLPVIAVSAVGSRLHAAREMGAVEALVKPVEPKELAAVARKAYRRAHV